MKLRSITLENVRRFTAPARIDGIGDGLNVLCEPNEHGKSTLFDAVQALFFSPHGSAAKEVKALRPHSGGAPQVTVEVETDEGLFAISKRWLSKPAATVMQGARMVAQADAAEAWIAALLGGGRGGPSGLVWVRQGMSGLAEGTKGEQDAALAARRDLMSSVAGEVSAMTGGRRMDRALARCRQELGELATSTGRPRGRWKAALEQVETLTAQRDDLAGRATALHDALDRRKRLRRELAELEDAGAAQARRARLDAAAEAHRSAERHAEEVEVTARKVAGAELAVSAAQSRLEQLRSVTAEWTAAQDQANAARAAADEARAELARTQADFDLAQAALDAAQVAQTTAETARRAAHRRQVALDGAARREELIRRIGQAETARRTMEVENARARHGPDADGLRQIEKHAADLATAIAMRDAGATQVVMRYAPGQAGTVRMDGAPLAEDRPAAIPRGAHLEIDGIGTLEIRAAASARADTSVESRQMALRAALDALSVADLDAARKAADARIDAERRHGQARAAYQSVAPDGIEPLRAALAAIPEPEEGDGGPDLAEAETALAGAETARVAAQARRDGAFERLSAARSGLARSEATETGARERLARACAAADRLGETDETALSDEFGRAVNALGAAEALLAEKRRSAPDLAAAAAALKRARSVEEEARARIAALAPEIATLDERIARGSGDAVEERLAETEQELEAAEAEQGRFQREVAVLQRLENALEGARAEAHERYFAPVAAELKPLLHLLWPEAELTWGNETLLPDALIRDGQTEPIDVLSGGTQEQVALLVRLAFARMLARDGRHAPVILDDALVFTDDDRIERMFDALHRQAGDLQILVLTCRQRAFRELGGRSLHLAEVGTAADAP